jgi:hypothetical protein
MFIPENGGPKFHFRPQIAESLLGVMLLDGLDDRLDSSGHFTEIDRPHFDWRKSKPGGVFDQVVDMSGMNQGLAWDAPVVEAVPSEFLFAPSWAAPAATVKPPEPPPRMPMS